MSLIEELLNKTDRRNLVDFFHFSTLNDNKQRGIGIGVDLIHNTGKISRVNIVAERKKELTDLESPEEIYRLAREYGGNGHLRIILHGHNREPSWDFSFYNWPWFEIGKRQASSGFQEERKLADEQRCLLSEIFDIFRVCYDINDSGKVTSVNRDQLGMQCRPEDVKKAYEMLLKTGYVPSIANGGRYTGFHLFQHYYPNLARDVIHSLHLSIGDRCSEIPHGTLELFEVTLRRQGFDLKREWHYDGDRFVQAKDSKNREKFEEYRANEWIWEENYKGQIVV